MKIPSQFFALFFVVILAIFSSCAKRSGTTTASTSQDYNYTAKEKSPRNIEEEEGSTLVYEDHIYKDNIHTTQLYVKGKPLSFPVIFLGDNKQLELHFDDLSANYQSYTYKFEHCNANWEPSGLIMQEYIDGFFDGFIESYEYSFNTLFRYIHYKVSFPNDQIRFKLSGNYIVKVYANNDEEDLLLSRRFYVVDKRVSVQANIHMATLARYRDYKQEVDFTINHTNYNIQDPYLDLKVVVSQNRRQDNAIRNLKPLFVRSPELVYNYEDENLFDGNNEYRFFDAKDLRYQAINVDGIQISEGKTHLFILPQEPRSFKRYYYQQDLNGRRLVKRDDSRNSDTEADYVWAHFNLKRETEVPNGDVYVFGELSDWEFKEDFKMEYVEVNNEYSLTTKIKQGYYNYNFAFLPDGSEKGDMSVIEGTHSETENDYYIFVYHRQSGEIYDRLVGFEIVNSNGISNN
jgi:hypothetical protein